MPEPRCWQCSLGIPLDTDTYAQFNGPVRCPHCLFNNHMTFSNANLLYQRPVLDDKYMIREAHSIPAQPLGDYREATACLTVGAWKACAVMARRAIQGALLERGVADARPRAMIDAAYNKHNYLTEKQHSLAATVTFFGGKGAHPEDTEINNITQIEAENGLWVTKSLLLALFP